MLGEKVSIVRAQSLLLIVLIDKSLDENDLKMSKWFERAKKRWTKYKQRVVKSLDTNYKLHVVKSLDTHLKFQVLMSLDTNYKRYKL